MQLLSVVAQELKTKMLYRSLWKPAISKQQLKKIEQACMSKLYAKCGFNRNTSKAVLAAAIELGGEGFTPLYVTAGTGYVTHFLKNWRTPTEDIQKQLQIVYA
jgi:hypothetical protein